MTGYETLALAVELVNEGLDPNDATDIALGVKADLDEMDAAAAEAA